MYVMLSRISEFSSNRSSLFSSFVNTDFNTLQALAFIDIPWYNDIRNVCFINLQFQNSFAAVAITVEYFMGIV